MNNCRSKSLVDFSVALACPESCREDHKASQIFIDQSAALIILYETLSLV